MLVIVEAGALSRTARAGTTEGCDCLLEVREPQIVNRDVVEQPKLQIMYPELRIRKRARTGCVQKGAEGRHKSSRYDEVHLP